jgi:hypothetical protein
MIPLGPRYQIQIDEESNWEIEVGGKKLFFDA